MCECSYVGELWRREGRRPAYPPLLVAPPVIAQPHRIASHPSNRSFHPHRCMCVSLRACDRSAEDRLAAQRQRSGAEQRREGRDRPAQPSDRPLCSPTVPLFPCPSLLSSPRPCTTPSLSPLHAAALHRTAPGGNGNGPSLPPRRARPTARSAAGMEMKRTPQSSANKRWKKERTKKKQKKTRRCRMTTTDDWAQ